MIERSMPGEEEISLTPTAFTQANEHRDYGAYTWSMDAALEAKAQSVFSEFGHVSEGAVIVDAGAGTGIMAELAAQTHRGATVYALDISPELQALAQDNRSLAKVKFGDVTQQNFLDNSIDIKYFSTSGHEVESFAGTGTMRTAVEITHKELKPGGKIIIRDFAKPESTKPILMQLLSDEGTNNIEDAMIDGKLDYSLLSDRALFLQFHQEFRGGNAFEYELVDINGTEYIKLTPEWAHEFYMRKDYRKNWENEVKEKYTYWTPQEAHTVLDESGFSNIRVIPDPNEFILNNRLDKKIALFKQSSDDSLEQLPFPDTHMVVVGEKPRTGKNEPIEYFDTVAQRIDFDSLKKTIDYDKENNTVTIDSTVFEIDPEKPATRGSKKDVFFLKGEPQRVLKVIRTDTPNTSAIFKAFYEAVSRQHILDEYNVPHIEITELDEANPPAYRYYVQEAAPEGSISAADLIEKGNLTEEDVKQIAHFVNIFEKKREWQLDTNPFNWYRVQKDDGNTEMVYVDGKVYHYESDWEFRKVGLLQWITPVYVSVAHTGTRTAKIPRVKEYEELRNKWSEENSEVAQWWKKHLAPEMQPQ